MIRTLACKYWQAIQNSRSSIVEAFFGDFCHLAIGPQDVEVLPSDDISLRSFFFVLEVLTISHGLRPNEISGTRSRCTIMIGTQCRCIRDAIEPMLL